MDILEAVLETPQINEQDVINENVNTMDFCANMAMRYLAMVDQQGNLDNHPTLKRLTSIYRDAFIDNRNIMMHFLTSQQS